MAATTSSSSTSATRASWSATATCTRGMLEFWIDPESPYAKPLFQQDKKFVFFCAGGMRSALAAHTAHIMGLKPVAHVEGGFSAWKKTGGPVEAWVPKQKG